MSSDFKNFMMRYPRSLYLACVLLLAATSSVFSQEQDRRVVTITLNTIAGLQYDQARFRVEPGAKVKIILKNQDDMSHNMLITKPGARARVVEAAMKLEEKGPEKDYIPDSPDVLWSIRVISPGEADSVTFTAPRVPGIYPYVCTFPGHGFSMYGAMYVTTNKKLPEIKDDINIPESRRKSITKKTDTAGGHSQHGVAAPAHPYEVKPPYLYRAYMENASPASIAVNLPHQVSYCWDAATCELRYAWKGDFVDNTGIWKGKPNAVARVLGEKFFEIKTRQPLRIGHPDAAQVAEYKGYVLMNRYPEFHYTINGVDVYELIRTNEHGTALIRTFRIPDATENVWFYRHPADGAVYECAVGTWQNNRIKISAEHQKNFTITMTKKEGAQK